MKSHKKFSSSKSFSLPFSPKAEPATLHVINLDTNKEPACSSSAESPRLSGLFYSRELGKIPDPSHGNRAVPGRQKTLDSHTAYSAGLSHLWEAWMSHGQHSLQVRLPQSCDVEWFGGAKLLTHPLGPVGHEAKACGNSSGISAKHCPTRRLPQSFLLLTNHCFLIKCCFVRKCSSTPSSAFA